MAINVGNLIVKNKQTAIETPVVETPTIVKSIKTEDELIARFYKQSPYMKDMINN
jgi:hypothetical protein